MLIYVHFFIDLFGHIKKKQYLCARFRVSPTRPAPSQFPQVLTEARVRGCSGAMQIAYPFFVPIGYSIFDKAGTKILFFFEICKFSSLYKDPEIFWRKWQFLTTLFSTYKQIVYSISLLLHPFSNRSLPYDCFATLRNLYKQAGTHTTIPDKSR